MIFNTGRSIQAKRKKGGGGAGRGGGNLGPNVKKPTCRGPKGAGGAGSGPPGCAHADGCAVSIRA